MNPNSTAIFVQRVTPRAGRNAVVVGVVSCLAVTGFAAAAHRAGAASSIQSDSDIVSVDHSHKGDRIPLAPKNISTVSSPVVTTLSQPPIGCEPAFSRVADPKRSRIFGRCIS
jgi:hypothetical protein